MRFLNYRTAKYVNNVLRGRDHAKQLNNSPQPQDYARKMNSHVVLIMRSDIFIRSRSPQSPYLKLPKYLTPGTDTFVISRLARERPISKRQLPQIDLSQTSLRLRNAEYALCSELSMLRFCTFHRTISSLVFMWTLNVSNQHYGQL